MNLLSKVSPWVVASFIATSSAFAQNNNCCKPVKCCEEMKQIQLTAGYNAPSRVEVRGCWDLYASGSFTYWQPCQDNIKVGQRIDVSGDVFDTRQDIINQKFNYKPGFKVALGMNFDHDAWDSKVEYTWFRGSDTSTSTIDGGVTQLSDVFLIEIGQTSNDVFSSFVQKWKLNMDLLDWDLARNYYVGKNLTFRTGFGARASWIRQRLPLDCIGVDAGGDPLNIASRRQSYAWGAGLRATVNTNWGLGEGFRIFGNGGIDTLFTQYTKATIKQTRSVNGSVPSEETTLVSERNTNCLRHHVDLEIGLGWGSYFDCNNWHVDLSAGYGFQVFFDQNMFRPFPNQTLGTTLPNGNLYMHGLTTTLRFDF